MQIIEHKPVARTDFLEMLHGSFTMGANQQQPLPVVILWKIHSGKRIVMISPTCTFYLKEIEIGISAGAALYYIIAT